MTALYMDSFDHYGTQSLSLEADFVGPVFNRMANAGWSFDSGSYNVDWGVGAPNWGSSRTGPNCLIRGSSGTNSGQVSRAFPTPMTRFFLSISIAVDSYPVDTTELIRFKTATNTELYSLNMLPNGSLTISQNNATGSVLATTSGPVITPQTWHYLEMEVNTAGNWVLRIDDATGTNTPILQAPLSGGTVGLMFLGRRNTTGSIAITYFDDIFLRDTNGTVNNSWLGDRRIATMFPNADTADAGWTPEYYKEISPGIATLGFLQAGSSTVWNSTAVIKTSPATALNIGNQDFTLETFIRFDRLPQNTENFTIFNKWNTGNATGRSYQLRYTNPSAGSFLEFKTSTDGTGATEAIKIQYPWAAQAGQWYHIALVRASGELLLFVDGVQLGLPIPDTDTYFASTTSAFAVGGQLNSTNTGGDAVAGSTVVGRLDETRFTNGVARYTSSFSPITSMFPRGVSDPNWSSVVLLMGYDVAFTDESSFARAIVTNTASITLPKDGDPPGAWTTVSKQTPDDNTFIRAPLTPATNILTLTTNPTATDTVTVGTTDGTTPAVYTFVSSLVNPFDVLIGATAQDSLSNLLEAINAGAGSGTIYGTGTTANADVIASSLPVGQFMVTALIAGTIGNSIAVASASPAVWSNAGTLTGGVDIPTKTSFKLQRPPTNTTIISALQINSRAKKTDSGIGSIQLGLIGPLGATLNGPVHSLSTSVASYHDIIESDPDTSGPISPTTLVNGKVTVNRTA